MTTREPGAREVLTWGLTLSPFALAFFASRPAARSTLGLDVLVQEQDKYHVLEGDALRDKLASKLACVSAIKAGDALTLEQQQILLNELLEIYSPSTCPHGRPTFIYVTLEELERRFLRR